MNIKVDEDTYEIQHEGLLRALFVTVNRTLLEARELSNLTVPDEWLEGVVENIVFGVAAVIDGSAVMEHEGQEVNPHIAFKNEKHSQELITNKIGSYLHEMVMGYLDEYDLDKL